MYLEHFGLGEPPFRITPHTDFFFSGANRGATLDALLYAITHDEGIVKVTGEVGAGKTMLCRVLIERLPPDVETVYLSNPSFEREEILQAILDDLKFSTGAAQRANQLLRTLQEHLISLYGAGKRVVLLIDEAHAMPAATLEQIRLLSNLESNRHKLLQIALFGQQELDEQLGTALLRPLRERITHSFRLEPLVHSDVGQYLMFRMRQAGYRGPDLFDAGALKRIAKSSEGLTRRLNILADKCLLAAYSQGEHGIKRKHALAAIRDAGFAPLGTAGGKTVLSRRWKWLAATSGVALAAAGVWIGMHLVTPPFGPFATVSTTKVPAPFPAQSSPAVPPQPPPAAADAAAVAPTPTSLTEQPAVASGSAQTLAPDQVSSSPHRLLAARTASPTPNLSVAAAATVTALESPAEPVARPIPTPLPSFTASAPAALPSGDASARRVQAARSTPVPGSTPVQLERPASFTITMSGTETPGEIRPPSRED